MHTQIGTWEHRKQNIQRHFQKQTLNNKYEYECGEIQKLRRRFIWIHLRWFNSKSAYTFIKIGYLYVSDVWIACCFTCLDLCIIVFVIQYIFITFYSKLKLRRAHVHTHTHKERARERERKMFHILFMHLSEFNLGFSEPTELLYVLLLVDWNAYEAHSQLQLANWSASIELHVRISYVEERRLGFNSIRSVSMTKITWLVDCSAFGTNVRSTFRRNESNKL